MAKAAILNKRIEHLESRVIYFVYRTLGAILFPAVLLYFLGRAARDWNYFCTIRQRLGFLPREYQQTGGGCLWFHAVSVGEAIAIVPLVRRIRELLPETPLFVSCSTIAGLRTANQKLGPDAVRVFFAPVDMAWAVRRVLRRIQPSVLVVTETEIWPNLFRESRRAGAAVLMVNGRISERTAKSYDRWRWFFRTVLRQVNVILLQSEEMRDRFLRAGAPAEILETVGNLKYDGEPIGQVQEPFLRKFFAGSRVWIAASTSADADADEEDFVIKAFQKLYGWKLLIAPRKPERFADVARKLERAGLAVVRRTELTAESSGEVLLLDTVGELAGLFGMADAVFMGGTLVKKGGHNVLEPARFGKTITVGPHLENFGEIAAEFRKSEAFHEIASPEELTPYCDEAMGASALACARKHQGATERAALRIAHYYKNTLSCPRASLPRRLFLGPLTALWKWGGARRLAQGLQSRRKLDLPVISVGNLTAGGTGKTPAVLHLAGCFTQEGKRAAVLTRGYGRASPHEVVVVKPGGQMSLSHTGDEAQILLRSGLVTLGVGPDRWEAGQQVQERGLADVFILDDGYQHVRVARDFDLLLIDGLAPFGGFELIPLGRLREPLTALGRASAFLITRIEKGAPVPAIEAVLRRWNPGAPVFRSWVKPLEWIDMDSGERFGAENLPFARTVAFCGLGNPRSFWNTLKDLKIKPLECLEYSDHHRYTPREVRRFGQIGQALGVEALLTTEKDLMNLCELTGEAIAPMRLFALRIGIEIEGETELLNLIRTKIRS